MPTNLENSAVATGLEKVSFHSNPKGTDKEWSNYHTTAHISHGSKLMLKIIQTRLQQYMNCELPDVQAGFRKGSSSSLGAAPGAEYVPLGAAGTRKKSARQLFPRGCPGGLVCPFLLSYCCWAFY